MHSGNSTYEKYEHARLAGLEKKLGVKLSATERKRFIRNAVNLRKGGIVLHLGSGGGFYFYRPPSGRKEYI